ncbi:hypothetical protein [Streptomyces europaeiscabiei]|nr:hypothetical protein [Streptomyces europaeiscabiei]MDX3712273.1 hypothetical protein [Streptomyces europaeiscabiei]MDX3866393.1 hypothetical protein [Streptomyces europaeiscabiei]MDX3873005.1 hypothetical protein [Streptomyces europaeiscabiei]
MRNEIGFLSVGEEPKGWDATALRHGNLSGNGHEQTAAGGV